MEERPVEGEEEGAGEEVGEAREGRERVLTVPVHTPRPSERARERERERHPSWRGVTAQALSLLALRAPLR
eukprot:1670372-Rhodomonas_salina.1